MHEGCRNLLTPLIGRSLSPKKEMIQLEAAFLERCFASWEEKHGLGGKLIDVHRDCYSRGMHEQWPGINDASFPYLSSRGHTGIYRSMLGRSLYADQLAHYFKVFEPLVAAGHGYAAPSRGNAGGAAGQQTAGAAAAAPHPYLHVVCTEDLKSKPVETMRRAAVDFLGLPPFDFTPVVSKGMYNVHGAEGYAKATKWGDGSSKPSSDPTEEISTAARAFLDIFFKSVFF